MDYNKSTHANYISKSLYDEMFKFIKQVGEMPLKEIEKNAFKIGKQAEILTSKIYSKKSA